MPVSTVEVELPHQRYTISIAPGLIKQLKGFIPDQVSSTCVITDTQVGKIYAEPVLQQLDSHRPSIFYIPPGEQSKSFDQYCRIIGELFEAGADRDTLVIALGGGVVGDLAGFVAATYFRGVKLLQIPTTLLAQVDSSVGGKVGINMPQAKNSVGAFWQPCAVVVDPDVLQTLDDENYSAGLAEVVKYGLIMDADFFELLEQNTDDINARDPQILTVIIQRCCRLKAMIVQRDERDTSGDRSKLNYGHTCGHAIESCFGYGQYLHGHAIGIGMTVAAQLAKLLDRVDDSFIARQTNLLRKLHVPTRLPDVRHEELLTLMRGDKKTVDGSIRFVLPTRLGHVELVSSIDESLIRQAMQHSV